MSKPPTRSVSTLNSQRHSLRTTMNDDPRDIAGRLLLENDHVDGVYDPVRGWQIVTLHQGHSLYLDCDEKAGEVTVSK